MRVIRSHVIVLISPSQNEQQHPELMGELPELFTYRETSQRRGKDLAEPGTNAWKLRVMNLWGPAVFRSSMCHRDCWAS